MMIPAATLLALLPVVGPAQPQERDAASLMPADSFAYVEAPGLDELFRAGLAHPFVARLLESPLAALALDQSPLTPEAAIAVADQFLGEPALPLLASLCAHGVALSVGTKQGRPTFSLVVQGDDEERWIGTIETALERVATQMGLPNEITEPAQTVRGLDMWLLGDELAFALNGATLLLANNEGRLRDMIDLAHEPDGQQSLATQTRYQLAKFTGGAASAAPTFAWGWADLVSIEAADKHAFRDLRAAVSEPAPHFLLGSTMTFLADAREVSARIALSGEELAVELTGFGIAPEVGAELVIGPGAGSAKVPRAIAGEVARGTFYRDLAGLFRVRGELFPARYQPNFAEATGGLALFFGGDDVSDSILPKLSPWIGFVSRSAKFDERAVPDVPLPAAALVVRVLDAEVGPRLVSAFQMFISVINIEAAQSMQPPLTLGLDLVEGQHPITMARYPPPAADEGVDIRYNLVPACCLVGDTFVIGTHASLVRELVGQIAAGEVDSVEVEELAVSGAALLHGIEANREALVMNMVVSEGKSMEKAQSDVTGLELITALVDSIRISTDRLDKGVHAARVSIALTPVEKK